ncbi:MAG: N-acetylglutaminylglutamine synthetase [Pseudomonadota bacterium]
MTPNREPEARQHTSPIHDDERSPYKTPPGATGDPNTIVDCGWGRLIFAHTFETNEALAEALREERPDRRDIAFYVPEPHVLLSLAPQHLFLDPSHTFRLNLNDYKAADTQPAQFSVRPLESEADAEAINLIYLERNMVPVPPEFFLTNRYAKALRVLVAEDSETGTILGSVMGVDHKLAFNDPQCGSSLWCLAVSPNAPFPGIGEALVRALVEQFRKDGAAYLDLSVIHDNALAIKLYEKLGFSRVPVFVVKRKNSINEKLFAGEQPDENLNPYARIIIDEARRRGIAVDVIDGASGLFRLTYGGRSVRCRESLSEFTSAVAFSICDDKRISRRIVADNGVRVPAHLAEDTPSARRAFLERYQSVVVKPARGEQGNGITVGVDTPEDLDTALATARMVCEDVVVEEFFNGEDLRLVVIDYRVVAAAIRRPAQIVGDGEAQIQRLIELQSRRRSAATDGESKIPLDAETERCVRMAGYALTDVLPKGDVLRVRKTANLHTGGTIFDVTGETHPELVKAAIQAARAIDIPVTGIDLMVRSHLAPEYAFIEANERPGLANHEPQPTAERFVDLLFPLSIPASAKETQWRQPK